MATFFNKIIEALRGNYTILSIKQSRKVIFGFVVPVFYIALTPVKLSSDMMDEPSVHK